MDSVNNILNHVVNFLKEDLSMNRCTGIPLGQRTSSALTPVISVTPN